MVTLTLAAVSSGGVAIGILGLVLSLRRSPRPAVGRNISGQEVVLERDHDAGARVLHRVLRVSLPLLVGCLIGVVTRWPVAAILGAIAAATVPSNLRKTPPGAAARRAEAIAGWTELVRDALAASAGLAQAIIVTAPAAPGPIRLQVATLAGRLSNGIPMADALRQFAADADDPAAEFLVCALMLSATSRAQKLVDVLGAMAESMREEVAMRLRVDAGRASARSGVRTIILFTGAFSFGLAVVAHTYLAPFGTPAGQMILAIVGLCYAAGLGLMVRLVRPQPTMRILDSGRAP